MQSLDRAHKLGIHHICTARTGTGNVAATAGFGGDIKIWRRKQDGRDDSWELWWDIAPSKSGGDIWAIAMSADEGYLACTTHDGKIKVWDLNRKEIEQTYETGGGAGGSFGMAVDLSRDGKLTASGHQSGAVYVFNNDAGRLSYSLPGRPASRVSIVSTCPDNAVSRPDQARSDSCVLAGLQTLSSGWQCWDHCPLRHGDGRARGESCPKHQQ